jgi:hypothetical protein
MTQKPNALPTASIVISTQHKRSEWLVWVDEQVRDLSPGGRLTALSRLPVSLVALQRLDDLAALLTNRFATLVTHERTFRARKERGACAQIQNALGELVVSLRLSCAHAEALALKSGELAEWAAEVGQIWIKERLGNPGRTGEHQG